jgi:hypothetical protein
MMGETKQGVAMKGERWLCTAKAMLPVTANPRHTSTEVLAEKGTRKL